MKFLIKLKDTICIQDVKRTYLQNLKALCINLKNTGNVEQDAELNQKMFYVSWLSKWFISGTAKSIKIKILSSGLVTPKLTPRKCCTKSNGISSVYVVKVTSYSPIKLIRELNDASVGA